MSVHRISLQWDENAAPGGTRGKVGELQVAFAHLPRPGELVVVDELPADWPFAAMTLRVQDVAHLLTPATAERDATHQVDVYVELVCSWSPRTGSRHNPAHG